MAKKLCDLFWIITSIILYIVLFLLYSKDILQSKSKLPSINGYYILEREEIKDAYLLAIYLVIIGIFLVWSLLKIYKHFIKANETFKAFSIKPAEPTYIPTYIGYFVLAISIESTSLFIIIGSILCYLLYKTKIFYFNPLLILWGYNYYEAEDQQGNSILLITKNKALKISTSKGRSFENLIRLNNFTFLELSK